jgi:hypothetical protein
MFEAITAVLVVLSVGILVRYLELRTRDRAFLWQRDAAGE